MTENSQSNNEFPQDGNLPEMDDMSKVMCLLGHIQKPCGMELPDGRKVNTREVYLSNARDQLESLTNPYAKKLLQDTIAEYEDEAGGY